MSSVSAGPKAGPERLALLQVGTRIVLVKASGEEGATFRLPTHGEDLAAILSGEIPEHLRTWIGKALPTGSSVQLLATDSLSVAVARAAGFDPVEIPLGALRSMRSRLFTPISAQEIVSLGAAELSERLGSPEEQVMSLSRECDRLERIARKDEELTENLTLSSAPGTSVEEYLRSSGPAISAARTRAEVAGRALTMEVERLLPNTSAVLGPRTSGRLLSAAGSLQSLSRMNASKVQLLGSRRRSVGRTPRYGLIFLAEGMDRVPPLRRGALGRTLASLATTAIRADLSTHADIAPVLLARKEARIRELNQRVVP